MLQRVRVLLVDGYSDDSELYRVGLSQLGAEVRIALTALEAIDLLTRERFDVIVSEIDLKDGWDGYALIQTIRGLPESSFRHLPAVALSGWAREEDRRKAIEAGFDEQCSKPCPPTDLAHALSKVLVRAVAARARI